MIHVELPLNADRPSTLWTFTGIRGVALPSEGAFQLGDGLSILPVSPFILSRRTSLDLNLRQQQEMTNVGHYLVYKSPILSRDPIGEDKAIDRLLNALMAIQIVKPSPTLGHVLQSMETDSPEYSVFGPSELRAPIDPGQWPSLRCLDLPFLKQAASMIATVDGIMAGTNVRRKNAIYLFQLALEHRHPAIACLLAVASMEACLKTKGAKGFEKGL